MYDCVIAGGGPSGSRLARVLARNGFSVLVLEEHPEIGVPVHCTGIVGPRLRDEFDLDPSVFSSHIHQVMANFPDGRQVKLPTPIRPLLVDRKMLDQHLAQKARDEGAELITGARVSTIEQEKDFVRAVFELDGKIKHVQGRLGILATGSMSPLPRKSGIDPAPSYYQSVQTLVPVSGIDGIELFLGDQVAPGSFAYAVGNGDGPARVGLITRRNSRKHFHSLVENSPLTPRLMGDVLLPVYRPMPFGVPGCTVSGRVMAVGDAACQLKSTTGGGVYFSIVCADILGKVITDSRQGGDFNQGMLKSYDTLWKKRLGTELKAGLALRRFLEGVGDPWWNRVGRAIEEPELSRLISEYRDFDNHHRFILEFFKNSAARRFVLEGLTWNLPGLRWLFGLEKEAGDSANGGKSLLC